MSFTHLSISLGDEILNKSDIPSLRKTNLVFDMCLCFSFGQNAYNPCISVSKTDSNGENYKYVIAIWRYSKKEYDWDLEIMDDRVFIDLAQKISNYLIKIVPDCSM